MSNKELLCNLDVIGEMKKDVIRLLNERKRASTAFLPFTGAKDRVDGEIVMAELILGRLLKIEQSILSRGDTVSKRYVADEQGYVEELDEQC